MGLKELKDLKAERGIPEDKALSQKELGDLIDLQDVRIKIFNQTTLCELTWRGFAQLMSFYYPIQQQLPQLVQFSVFGNRSDPLHPITRLITEYALPSGTFPNTPFFEYSKKKIGKNDEGHHFFIMKGRDYRNLRLLEQPGPGAGPTSRV